MRVCAKKPLHLYGRIFRLQQNSPFLFSRDQKKKTRLLLVMLLLLHSSLPFLFVRGRKLEMPSKDEQFPLLLYVDYFLLQSLLFVSEAFLLSFLAL